MTHAYSPHQIKSIRPLRNYIVVRDMNFEHRVTTAGIVLPSDDGKNQGIRPRWAEVYAVGPEQHEITVGQWILVEHGRWTRGIKIDDGHSEFTIRKIDPEAVMMVSDEPVTDDTLGALGV